MKLLTQNTKMQKSSTNKFTVVNWTIPAFMSKTGLKTCPNAGLCSVGCYARSGTYAFSNVAKAHEAKLQLTLQHNFANLMIEEINNWLSKKTIKHLKVRIHDAGDFYSLEYLEKWFSIMNRFKGNPNVSFYAYTKQVDLFKKQVKNIPENFRIIFSFGGKQDSIIDVNKDFHSRVFESIKELKSAGYVDGTQDDMVAAIGTSKKIGLVYHGVKNFSNTQWDKVG